MDDRMERRGFVKLLAGAGIAGTALLEACVAEASEDGTLTPETIEALLAYTDQERPGEEDMEALVDSLEGHVRNIRKVRAWSVDRTLEPSLKFRAGPASWPRASTPTSTGSP